jgi:acetyl-CoA C-acetyltransferase
MRDVAIIGIGQTPVGEHWEMGLRQLALDALRSALEDAGIDQIDALIVANALGGNLSAQNHVGTLVADYAGLEQFEGFSINAHANGATNPFAMYRNKLRPGAFAKAPVVADPVNLFDSAPEGDGAAAVILTTAERALDSVPHAVRVRGSGAATDTLALHNRRDLLFLQAANLAAGRAYEQAGIGPEDIDLAELHDSYTVLTALQLEAAGFAPRGEGWKLAAEGALGRDGRLPISTFGGLKARGNPLGATGVYQAVEIVRQLRHDAGENQVPDARLALALNLGGLGGTAVAHVFERIE